MESFKKELPSVALVSYQEVGPGDEPGTIITYDYGWGIYPIGNAEPIRSIRISHLSTGKS